MPSALGWFTGIFSSGVLVSCPITFAHVNGKRNLSRVSPPSTPVVKVVEPKVEKESKPAPTVQEVMQEMIKENNYLGCGLLSGFRDRKTIWYVCSSQDGLNTPTFYNYDKSKPAESRNRQMVSISSSRKAVTFTKGVTESLALPFWMSKFQGKDLEPEKNCKFIQQGTRTTSYNLKCHEQTLPHAVEF
ncbi:hypothetical protein DNK47_01095 [Mycoplasma wenyonii]|uniref:Uncharacterized protein n=1 Tax=Mycoplasma wenyonii TaxID=65123 RepID=A0A328PQQ0_9MOLU|nr:hypothetical protein [Mycoplasma wenyonii]RAO95208.1 hypothetical protein DNK47_01095 [Mycoplasma wenyonii]